MATIASPYFALGLLCFGQFHSIILSLRDDDGLVADLIHRDSPQSPVYTPSTTHEERLRAAFRRSVSRLNRFGGRLTSSSSWPQRDSLVCEGNYAGLEYYIKVSFGTPPFETPGIADTASDLSWIQCKPCRPCYKQSPPIFDSTNSSTYQLLPCGSDPCKALRKDALCLSGGTCGYNYTYADGSFTAGDIATETLTLGSTQGSPLSFPNITFGCGHSSKGIFDEHGSGIIGLGWSSLSLIFQLDSVIQGKFSYCLVPYTNPNVNSKFYFGKDVITPVTGAVSMPIILKPTDSYYYITLEGVSVEETRVAYRAKGSSSSTGNMIIDLGTTFNFIPAEMYDQMEKQFVDAIRDLERVKDPQGISQLCFLTRMDISGPNITLHLTGADLVLPPLNTFIRVMDTVVCLTFIPTTDLPILGNLGQSNFKVGFDLKQMLVTFAPADCT